MPVTKEQLKAAFNLVAAVSEILHAVKEIPSGELYVRLMEKGCSLESYTKIIDTIKGAGLVKERPDHMLVWIGPNLPMTTKGGV